MKGSIVVAGIVALAALAALFPADATARNTRADFEFGGKWHVTLDTPLGEIPVTVSLQPNGKGKLWLQGGGTVPVVHQTVDTWISWAIELPAVQSPDGNAHTIIGRGMLGEEPGAFSGEVIIVTAIKDAESRIGYETHVGTFDATRKALRR
ncbi:MAG TPA: hypothetical protein VFS92_00810 [Planctomycetota bacterium]|nr:hypothetical protein [Planctomycetota bacterium]